MPTVDIDPDELRDLTGHDEKSDDDLIDDLFGLGPSSKGARRTASSNSSSRRTASIGSPSRASPARCGISTATREGARSSPNSSEWTIEVEESVPDERPYVTGAVVRDVDLDEEALESPFNCRRNSTRRWGASARRGRSGFTI